mgnify:FL=1
MNKVKKHEFVLSQLSDCKDFAEQFFNWYPKKNCFAFSGEMGAGKTTIINSLLQHLGINDFQGSPTFAIVQSYLIPTNENCYHIDAYRIDNKEEALAIGFDEIMNEEAYFFIEWPEKIESFLPDNTIWVYIRESESNKRIIQIEE